MLIALSAGSALLILIGSAILFHLSVLRQRLRRDMLRLARSEQPGLRQFAAYLSQQHELYVEGLGRSHLRLEWTGQAMLLAGALLTLVQAVAAMHDAGAGQVVVGMAAGVTGFLGF